MDLNTLSPDFAVSNHCSGGASVYGHRTPPLSTSTITHHPLTIMQISRRFHCMFHSPINLPETHPDYPTIYADEDHRVIVCKDRIQYILQRRKGTQWHNRSFFVSWDTLSVRNPHLPLQRTSPMRLANEIPRQRRCEGYESEA